MIGSQAVAPARPPLTFQQRVSIAVTTKCHGNIAKAARDAGVETTTLWYFLHDSKRSIALRTFACLCTWAGIDPREVIEEFTA